MSRNDVEPLADDAKTPRALREMIHAARHEVPSEEQLGSLMSRLEGIEAAAPSGAGIRLLKVAPVILVMVALGSFWLLGRDSSPNTSPLLSQSVEEPPGEVVPVRAHPVQEVEGIPDQGADERVVDETPEKSASPKMVRPIKTTPATVAATPSEPTLVQAARRALQSQQWDESMRLVRAHEKQYPTGILSEEREAIAVEALASSGELAKARTRLKAMASRFPGSTYRAHLESLMAQDSE